MNKNVIVNASPLIVLVKSDLAFLLPKIYETIIVPKGVFDEIMAGKPNDPARHILPKLDWLIKKPAFAVEGTVEKFDLGRGESEVISLGLETENSIVMMDDAAARDAARQLSLQVIGTGGFLAIASRRGLIESFPDALRSVQTSGLWLSPTLIELLIELESRP